VKRTRDRPIASRRIAPYEAVVWFLVLVGLALALVLQLDKYTIRMSVIGAVILATVATGLLVGVSRAITDFSYCTYLSDLAVDEAFQRRGIGRELIRRTHEAAGLHTSLILLAAPKAESYYPHIGMQPHPSCWRIPAVRS
jgi:ribosomal protein S18 acetylase RimI-like enzyme